MSQVNTEETNLASSTEGASTLGTIPSSGWRNHQPTAISRFGNMVKKLARDIISSLRQREQGRAVDADSGVDTEFDVTVDSLDRDAEDMFKSTEKFSGGTGVGRFTVTAVVDGGGSADSLTVAAGGALPERTLMKLKGFTESANNNLFMVAASSVAASIKFASGSFVAEASPPTNNRAEVAGYRGATADIRMDGSGNLTSEVAGIDFTTLGLNVGQWIWVGGAVGTAMAFATATYRGWARLKTIAAHLLTLEFRSWTVGAADAAAGKTIDLYWGSWIRNVGSLHSDFKKPSRTFEWTLPRLGTSDATVYWYSRGAMGNTYEWSFSPGDKVTCQANFIGTITDEPTETQATGGSSAMVPTPGTIGMFTTSSDLARLRLQNVDETGLSIDFKSMTVKFNNNVKADKQLGVYGASKLIVGGFDVDIDAVVLLDDPEILKSPSDNRKASLNTAMRNEDGAAMLDVPCVDIEDAPPDAARNESVRVKVKLGGRRDPVLNYTSSLSRLPYCPAA